MGQGTSRCEKRYISPVLHQKKGTMPKELDIKLYKGGNEIIDALLAAHWPGVKIVFVNGPKGRRPITLDKEEPNKAAIAIYEAAVAGAKQTGYYNAKQAYYSPPDC